MAQAEEKLLANAPPTYDSTSYYNHAPPGYDASQQQMQPMTPHGYPPQQPGYPPQQQGYPPQQQPGYPPQQQPGYPPQQQPIPPHQQQPIPYYNAPEQIQPIVPQEAIPYHYAPQTSVAPTGPDGLPQGWIRTVDSQGRPYFIDTATRCSQWEHPVTGVVYSQDVPAYEVPSYYDEIAKQQAEDNGKEHTYTNPSYDQQPSTTSQYHPSYYDTQLDKMETLDKAQLEGLSVKYLDTRKYAVPLTRRQKICGTFSRFKTLTVLTILTWIAAIVPGILIVSEVFHPSPDEITQAFIPAYVAYFIYFCIYICPAGVIPLSWFCCGRTGIFSEEKIVETLRRSTAENCNKLISNIDQVTKAYPSITMHVECYHYETRERWVTRTRTIRNSDGTTRTETYREKEYYQEKVTTFRAHQPIPIVRFRDISAPAAVVADTIEQCESNMLSVSYKYVYDTHPSQANFVSTCKRQYYYRHAYRDDHCHVSSSYTISSYQPSVDVVVKQKDCGYWMRQIFFFNPISFFIWAYLVMYLVPAIAFRSYSRVIPYDNVKYLHLAKPKRESEVVTYRSLRWRHRWDWW